MNVAEFTRRPKGQSTVEYVLIIAIMVLVVLIAGPWVSSAIRNQFNLVAGSIGNGYALSDGNAYSSSSVPDNKADTYYTTKALLDQARR